MNFERTYRLHGAITAADQRQRFGNYFDFFWRVKRPANVTVRLEYRQEKLRSFVQAREVSYPNAKGNHKTEFAIIGDDYLNDGRVITWRCLLIENGRIVAENRSYLWEMRWRAVDLAGAHARDSDRRIACLTPWILASCQPRDISRRQPD